MASIKRNILVPVIMGLTSVMILVIMGVLTHNKPPLQQPDEEILAIMESTGYSNIKLGMVVKQLPGGIFGPCKLFIANNTVGDKINGGYCTPDFMASGIHVINPE